MDERKNVISNFFWRLLERCGAQVVSLVVSVILARILAPEAYGTIALITVFTNILSVFVRSGMASSLIQKNGADALDYSTVFYFNVATSILLYALMFFCAPLIASFYNSPAMTLIIRISSLSLIVGGVRNVLEANVSKRMLFKRMFFATFIGTVTGAVFGIWAAYNGYGVWALVIQHLTLEGVSTFTLWLAVRWWPRLAFSFGRLKNLFSFGWKLLVSTLIDAVYTDIRQLIIGKMYTSADLAYYNRGNQFPAIIKTNVNTSIDSVLFPTMAKAQDDNERLKSIVRRSIQTSTYIMAPLLFGLAALSEQFIALLLTEKWNACVPFLRIFCITYLFYPIQTANLNSLKAMGRSDLCLKLEAYRKILATVIIAATIWFGPLAICVGELIATAIGQIFNVWPNKKLLQYSFWEQCKDIFPSILLAGIMAVVVWFVGKLLPLPMLPLFVLQILIGAVIYIVGSLLLRLHSFQYILDIMKSFIKRKTTKNHN